MAKNKGWIACGKCVFWEQQGDLDKTWGVCRETHPGSHGQGWLVTDTTAGCAKAMTDEMWENEARRREMERAKVKDLLDYYAEKREEQP